MSAIVFTPFVAGATLTAAQLNTQQTEITTQVNGNLDSANITSGGVNNDRLAAPMALFCISVPFSLYADALESVVATPVTAAQYQAARVGTNTRVGTTADLPVGLPFDATFVSLHTSCLTSTGINNARLRRNGADVAGTTVAFTTGTLVRPSLMPTQVSTPTTDTLLIRVTVSGGANDGVVGGVVYVFFKLAHRVSSQE